MFVCFACPLSPFPLFIIPCLLAFLFGLLLRGSFQGSFHGAPFRASFTGAPFRAPFRGSFYGAPFNVTVPHVTLIFILNGFLITSQDDGLSTLDSFQANSIDCIDYSQ